MDTRAAASFFARLPGSVVPAYRAYWRRKTPLTDFEVFRRWVFAFTTVHSTWRSSVAAYRALRDGWDTRSDLRRRLVESGGGLHNHRARWLARFESSFWAAPSLYRDWRRRDELVEQTQGLGDAKVSFALNLVQPLESRVVCLDVHLLRLYGVGQAKCNHKIYRQVEADWLSRCPVVEPYIAHSIYWDRVQGQTRPDYWAHIL